jgi:hypothetical protein
MAFIKRIVPALLLLSFFSCKKDNKTDTPTVQITAPTGLPTYNVFDSIRISGTASDPQGLRSINVFLSTGNSIPIMGTAPVTVTSNTTNFSLVYVLNDIHLASGNYYVTVGASNGTNSAYAYQEIYVKAAPTIREAVYAITRSGTTTQVWKMDSMLHSSLAATEPGNFINADISSYYQQLFVSAYDTGNMNAINVPGVSPAWSIPGVNTIAPYFTNVYSVNDVAYVSLYNGDINYYDTHGNLQSQYLATLGYYPIKTFLFDSYLFTEQKNISGPSENLVLYYPSGGSFQQAALPGPLVAMYGQDNDDIFVFGNSTSGNPYFEQYSISKNLFYSPISLPSAKLLSATQIDANTYLIGFANSTVYLYTWNPNSMVSFVSGINANKLRYDVAGNTVIAAVVKSVNQYNYTTGALMYTTPLPDTVKDVQILYNK